MSYAFTINSPNAGNGCDLLNIIPYSSTSNLSPDLKYTSPITPLLVSNKVIDFPDPSHPLPQSEDGKSNHHILNDNT